MARHHALPPAEGQIVAVISCATCIAAGSVDGGFDGVTKQPMATCGFQEAGFDRVDERDFLRKPWSVRRETGKAHDPACATDQQVSKRSAGKDQAVTEAQRSWNGSNTARPLENTFSRAGHLKTGVQ